MPEKLKEIISRYETLIKELNSGNVHNSNELKLMNIELNSLNQLYPLAVEYMKNNADIEFAEESLKNTTDKAEKTFYQEVIDKGIIKKEELEAEINKIAKKDNINDNRNAILEIRAGTGGEEASLFAAELFRMYIKYAENKGWNVEQMHKSGSETGGIKEVIALITGNGVYGKLKHESGVHRVQRIPSTESSGRIHTSSASVVVLPEVQDIEVEIKEDDIKIDVFRSGGAGGQSVNTTDSAVRITHLPSGIIVSCQDERSQLKNKNRAISILKSKLFDLKLQEQLNKKDQLRKDSIRSGDRSEKIRTYNFPQSRVTDHRIQTSWFNLGDIIDGNIDAIVQTLNEKL